MKNSINRTRYSSWWPPAWVSVLIASCFTVALIFYLQDLAKLFLISYLIAFCLNPMVSRLEGKRIGRGLGTFLVFFLLLLVLALLVLTVLPVLIEELTSLFNNLPDYYQTARIKLSEIYLRLFKILPKDLANFLNSYQFINFAEGANQSETTNTSIKNNELIKNIFQFLGGNSSTIASSALSALVGGYSITVSILNVFLIPMVVYYLLIDFKGFHYKILQLFPKKYKSNIKVIALEVNNDVSAFINGQLLVGSTLAILYTMTLGFIGVELWLPIGLFAGYGNIVPYLGSVLGFSFALIMTLVTYGDLFHLAVVFAIFVGGQLLESMVLTPLIIGDKVGLSPLAIIFALYASGSLFGMLGLVVAIPLAATIRTVGKHFYAKYLE
jgi:predicted PurR-regulated permease PerM